MAGSLQRTGLFMRRITELCGIICFRGSGCSWGYNHRAKMITIEEIPVRNIDEFWDIHIRYLIDDSIITDDEDVEYFTGAEYRDVIKEHMLRDTDRHHLVYFVRDSERIGAASYCTYIGEEGKCFLMDYWLFGDYRGNGAGHECFEALERYTKDDGARYYEINCEKEDAVRFWKSLGFIDNGRDEYDMPLLIKR